MIVDIPVPNYEVQILPAATYWFAAVGKSDGRGRHCTVLPTVDERVKFEDPVCAAAHARENYIELIDQARHVFPF